jgi:GxxExxY protein
MDFQGLSKRIIGCAIEVHRTLGPGLLESVYKTCLAYELDKNGLNVRTEVSLPVKYKDLMLRSAYRIDMIVEGEIILELKAVDQLQPLYGAQLLSYLRLSHKKLGLLMNFNVPVMKQGIKRIVNNL